MRKYEIMYILRPDLDKDATAKLNEKLAKTLTDKGAKITKTDEWGLRDLAYAIEKVNKGYYVVLEVEAENAALNEFKRISNLDSNVLRFLITKAHEGAPVSAKAEADSDEDAKDNH